MTWLSGKPRRVLSLHWPENDPVVQRARSHPQRWEPPGTYNVLDDQVLRTFTPRVDEPNGRPSVYLAKIYEAIASGATAVAFVKIATLPHLVHSVALLPGRVGFVSLEFTKDTSTITLRIHKWDGTVSNEKIVHGAAAYGQLVVNRHTLAICISSGKLAPPEMCLNGSPDVYHRVDAYSSLVPPEPKDLTGDQIVCWRFEQNVLTIVQIPQSQDAPLTHQANFQFVGDSHIALGGNVLSCFGTPSALLKSFHIDDPDRFSRTFTHGENFEMDDDIGVVAIPGSSGGNAVLVNYHQRGSRLTVVDNRLLVGDIDSEPRSEDPPGLHPFWDHPQYSRTIEGTINEFLPSISDNRLLVAFHIDDNPAYDKFASNLNERDSNVFFLFDFDQTRCNEVCNLTATGRTSLESKLLEENADARVRVVERNFYVSIEEEEDMEWSPGSQRPPEWSEHLRQLYKIEESRKEGTVEYPVLEFDEAPATLKRNPRILFTRSVLCLPKHAYNRRVEHTLALTTSGIVLVPTALGMGHVFLFGDS